MIHTEEDDDIQDYVDAAKERAFVATFHQVVRNETLEEVAKEIEKMKAFEKDTMASFAAYIRGMKR
jgi:hypothetical protein